MKLFLLIGIFFNCYTTFAQADSMLMVPAKTHPFYVGIHGASTIAYRSLIDNDGADINSSIIAFRDGFEQPKFSYNGDLFAGFAFRKRWSVELGVGFSNRGYKTEELYITTIDNPEGDFIKGRLITNDYYLDIPVRVNALFGKKRVKLLTSAGLITGLFVETTSRKTSNLSDDTNIDSSIVQSG